MRFKLLSLLSILLIVGSNDARPSNPGSPEVGKENVEKSASTKGIVDETSSRRPNEPRGSSVVKSDSRTELKSLDQSLRTVATQLLNVTNPNESKESIENPNTTNQKISNVLLIQKNNEKTNYAPSRFGAADKSVVALADDVDSDKSSIGLGFGRPVNSKFGYFESSHPGVAMAMTEEELERELSSSTRLMTAHKNHPTTTGGISTWILLNSPTTTNKPLIDRETISDQLVNVRLQNQQTTPIEIFETTSKSELKTVSTFDKISSSQSTTPMERITTLSESTTPSLKKTTVRPIATTEKTSKPVQTTLNLEKSRVTSTPKTFTVADRTVQKAETTVSVTTPKTTITTRKSPDSSRSTMRPKLTTPKPIDVTSKPMTTKISRPSAQSIKPKPSATRKTTTKSSVETTKHPSTSKIEKVTFRPVAMITTPKSIDNQMNVERPFFLTKLKTSFTADSTSHSVDTSITTNNTTILKNETKSSDPENSSVVTKMKKPSKTSNVLKVQLKKPTESPTNIEIEAIKVNAPVLRIEKIESKEEALPKRNVTKVPLIPENSRIDVEFNFNPEIKKAETESSSQNESIATTTTTKRPHKRKKNKLRRRRPTSPAPSSSTSLQTTSAAILTDSPTIATSTESFDVLTELGIIDNAIQESKIAPESKITTETANGIKNKKKQVQKPIGTQIYNFLSREVMPSFGVMSLVGLGLGLASYFLYPFGGAIARRNYVVEPNYKYNMEEYGGNYGQSEEEVFSKVLQGMTNKDGKYGGIKDYETNFYRYQQAFDHSHPDVKPTTKRIAETFKYTTDSAAIYRPMPTNNYASEKYRNTDFKYPELSTTSNYYDRLKKPDFVGKKSADRQFVVGNIPKEYNYDNRANLPIVTDSIPSELHDNYKFSGEPVDVSSSYGHPEALKSNADYQEIEITPSAVQVEHGPRSLNLAPEKLQRKKRESVIQLIPSRTEIEKEEKEIETEEPLSNEILDIIDSVIPTNGMNNDNRQIYHVKADLDKKTSGLDLTSKQPGSNTNEDSSNQITSRPYEEDSSAENMDKTTVGPKKIAIRIEATRKTNLATETNEEKIVSTEGTKENSSEVEITSSEVYESGSTTPTISSTVPSLTIDEILGTTGKTDETNSQDSNVEGGAEETTKKPNEERFNIFSFVKKIAEVKLRLGVAILKHASEGFARYLGHVQKRINGEE